MCDEKRDSGWWIHRFHSVIQSLLYWSLSASDFPTKTLLGKLPFPSRIGAARCESFSMIFYVVIHDLCGYSVGFTRNFDESYVYKCSTGFFSSKLQFRRAHYLYFTDKERYKAIHGNGKIMSCQVSRQKLVLSRLFFDHNANELGRRKQIAGTSFFWKLLLIAGHLLVSKKRKWEKGGRTS